MTRVIRLRFWLAVMDMLSLVGLFGSRPYSWALVKASDSTDWGDASDSTNESEAPF